MAISIPIPRSYNQIVSDQTDAFLSRFGITSLKIGGPVLSFIEASSQSDLRSSQDIFNLLDSQGLDTAEGLAIDFIGNSEGVPRITENFASSTVTLGDSSFTKISSKIYQGLPAPIVGSTSINVSDAFDFPVTGSVYFGRGTSNFEGPIAYTSKVNNTSYWTLTLSSGTLRFHNTGDTVVVAQGGNRLINSGAIVQTKQGNITSASQYKTLYSVTIPDGETSIENVAVIALKTGLAGNVPDNAINEFASPPFDGATVNNPLPVTNGRPTEDDDVYKERIRNARKSRSKGTATAIIGAVVGIVSLDENKRVQSASLVNGESAVLYLDDGTGYEERSEGIPIESFTDSAIGGESFFKISAPRPITKAEVSATIDAPFSLITGSKLSFAVGGVVTEHTFNADEFDNITNASTFEVVASINANPSLLWNARPINSGMSIAVFAKSNTNESIENIEIISPNIDANDSLVFPSGRVDTMRLYKNDRLLNKDGKIASVRSNSLNRWEVLVGPQTLEIAVDKTPSLTFTFTDQDFIDAQTGFTSLGANTPIAWAMVFNAKIPGITASVVAGTIVLTSNKGSDSKSKVEILSGSLVNNNMFALDSDTGESKDYTLDRNTGEIELNTILEAGDRLAAGSINTRAFLESDVVPTTTLSSDGKLWFSVDGKATIIPSALTASTNINITPIDVLRWGLKLRIESSTGTSLFGSLRPGDWAIFWDSALTGLSGAYRVSEVDTTIPVTYFDIEKKAMDVPRGGHTATLLASGKILITGGYTGSNKKAVTDLVEIFDPSDDSWTSAARMSTPRAYHTATKLASGKVLVVGGQTQFSASAALKSAEIYDPTLDSWTTVASLPSGQERYYHTANLLATNNVLIVGGRNSSYLNSVYLYDPTLDTWTAKTSMVADRALHTATLTSTNDVLVAAGEGTGPVTLNSTELYSVGGNTWSNPGNLPGPGRQGHRAVLRSDNKVMVVGGSSAVDGLTPVNITNVAEYSGAWVAGPAVSHACSHGALVRLTDNSVVSVYGNHSISGDPAKVDIYSGGVWTTGYAMPMGLMNRVDLQALESSANQIIAIGGFDTSLTSDDPSATAEIYDKIGDTWIQPDISTTTNLSLTSSGLTFARSDELLEDITIPAAANYTASSFVDQLNSQLIGAVANTYRTNIIRTRTNTFNENIGDIALVAANVKGKLLQISLTDHIDNVSGHLASVESGSSEIDVPDFHQTLIHGSGDDNSVIVQWSDLSATNIPNVGGELVVLKDQNDQLSTTINRYGTNAKFSTYISELTPEADSVELFIRKEPETSLLPNGRGYFASSYAMYPDDEIVVVMDEDSINKRFPIKMGRKLKTVGTVYASQNEFADADNSNNSLAKGFGLDFDFNDYAIFMAARTKTHSSDPTKVVLWRYFRLGPDGNNARLRYVYPDLPNSSVSITSDAITDLYTDIDVALGSGALKTGYPLTAAHKIGTICTAKTGNYATVSYILGLSILSAIRTGGNTVTLTLDIASSGASDHGLIATNVVFVTSNNINFATGLVTITSVTPNTIVYTEAGANTTVANIGTVSFGPSEATLAGATPAVSTGDFFRVDSTGGLPADFEGKTLKISSFPTNQTIIGNLEDFAPAINTVISWNELNDLSAFKVFSNSGQAAAAIVAAINAAAPTNIQYPVSPTLGGNGSGVINTSSADEAGSSPVWFNLTDGINYVKTTVNPLIVTNNYQFVFKSPINSTLTTFSDWANEDVRLVPVSIKNMVDWFNSPTISGLFTACATEASSQAHKLQLASLTPGSDGSVQVQGGSANSNTITVSGSSVSANSGSEFISVVPKSLTNGLFAGNWTEINNSIGLPKNIINTSTKLKSISPSGEFVFDNTSSKIWDNVNTPTFNAVVQIEKQGKYVAVNATAFGNTLDLSSIKENDYVIIRSPAIPTLTDDLQISSVNTGTFRIIRVVTPGLDGNAGMFWIENSNVVESKLSECDIRFVKFDSTVIGDVLQISTNTWGIGNRGTWTIASVGITSSISAVGGLVRTGGNTVTVTTTTEHGLSTGDYFTLTPGETSFPTGNKKVVLVIDNFTFTYTETGSNVSSGNQQNIDSLPFTNFYKFRVDVNSKFTQAINFSPVVSLSAVDAALIHIIEGIPGKFIKQILSISPNQTDPTFYDIKFTTPDEYTRISEAAGSVVSGLQKFNFSTSIAKGIDGYRHSIGIIGEANRVLYGDPSDPVTYPGIVAIGSQVYESGPIIKRIKIKLLIGVKSGVPNSKIASAIKSSVAAAINSSPTGTPIALSDVVAASRVSGVTSVTILSPAYNASNTVIPVQPSEKPKILNLDTDVLISFVGE